ncbi:hypothetical protein [Burkholderia vietnamiensis]|uniref:hypothetical protein n=1 Tax=Burkholderia vietnamiensis TaxID=60552 RepID=UPI00075E41DF|nr:hypothetical protein [Burkholderia vietnamiensis]KVS13847.1 hypothetical protein WK29_16235 [Burkholderia vietnamiensis]MCA7985365.1 hypothetical protein [Burkholderia vietnamiensis]HDR8932820.1 hypothetical protein [Burkholderia vietnamiensis]
MHDVVISPTARAIRAASNIRFDRKLQRSSGSAFRSAVDCAYPPAIQETDILHVDFDIDTACSDGLYLVEVLAPDASRVEWRGCRRFAVTADGVQVDISGTGEWVTANLDRWGMRIAGKVLEVYRSTTDRHVGTEVSHG